MKYPYRPASVADPLCHMPNFRRYGLLRYDLDPLLISVVLLRASDGIQHYDRGNWTGDHVGGPFFRGEDIMEGVFRRVESQFFNITIEKYGVGLKGEPLLLFLVNGHGAIVDGFFGRHLQAEMQK